MENNSEVLDKVNAIIKDKLDSLVDNGRNKVIIGSIDEEYSVDTEDSLSTAAALRELDLNWPDESDFDPAFSILLKLNAEKSIMVELTVNSNQQIVEVAHLSVDNLKLFCKKFY